MLSVPRSRAYPSVPGRGNAFFAELSPRAVVFWGVLLFVLRFLLRVSYFCKPCILLLPSKNTVKNHGVFTFFTVLLLGKSKMPGLQK